MFHNFTLSVFLYLVAIKPILMRLLWMLLVLSHISVNKASAGDDHLYPVTLEQRIQNATLIIEGKVISQQSFWDIPHKNIYTSNLIQVNRILKGSTSTYQLEIVTEGGRVNNHAEILSSTLTLKPGQLGIFFCIPNEVRGSQRPISPAASYTVYSSLQGFIRYDTHSKRASDPFKTYNKIDQAIDAVKMRTGKDVRVNNGESLPPTRHKEMQILSVPAITGFSPTTISAGTGSVLIINGNNFGNSQGNGFVQFKNANTGGANLMMNYEFIRPLQSDYVLWTNNQIRVKVPSCSTTDEPAGTGEIQVVTDDFETASSTNSLTIPFAQTNFNFLDTSYPIAHINANGTGGYSFQRFSGFAANAGASAAFTRAINSWVCATSVNWAIGPNTNVDEISADGVSVVRFDVGSELPAGILGRCTNRLSICQASTSTFYITEIDFTFDDVPHFPWQFGPAAPTSSQYDFESVALHELGHAQQLGHVIATGEVMHFSISNGQQSRALSAADINGGNYIMARSFGYSDACGMDGMIAKNCSVLPVTLTAFSGTYLDNIGTHLQWKTMDETNIKGYTVMRSMDGAWFKDVGHIESLAQNTSNLYSFKDLSIFTGRWQYKLMIHHGDGSFKYSDIVIVANNPGSKPEFTLSPNPAKSRITLSVGNLDLRSSCFEVFAMDSRKVYSHRFTDNVSSASKEISVDHLPKGIYVYVLTTGKGEKFIGKMIID